MRIRNRYRYFIQAIPFGSREVFPLGENQINENYGPFEADFVNDYLRTLEGKLKLTGLDFQFLYQIETSVYRCDSVNITVQRFCGESWSNWYTGSISLSKCEFNPEMCEVDFQIERADAYTCFEEKRDQDVDLFELVPTRYAMGFLYPDSVLEVVNYITEAYTEPTEFWGGLGEPQDGGWVLFRHEFLSGNRSPNPKNICGWIREKRTVDCNRVLSSPWILVSENCPGTGRTYARKPVLYALQKVEVFEGDLLVEWSRIWKVMGRTGDGLVEIDNGMRLNDVLAAYFTTSCSLNVVSDFFQLNPENTSSTNYVTGLASKVRSLLVFQKSDVKRPGDLDNASRCKINFERFFFGLCRLFNLEYWIIGNTIRIEHVSFKNRVEGIDLTDPALRKWTRFKSRYSYDTARLPREERFLTQEKTLDTDFEGVPILYGNACASTGGEGKKEYTVEEITTDLQLVLNNPEADSKAVTDAGVFLAATDAVGGGHYLITEAGILGDSLPNNSLAWSQLLRDYYRHKRPFKTGRMNNQDVEFESVIPVVKGEEVYIPLCCGDTFNPENTMRSALGVGVVDSSSFSLGSGILTINLMYEAKDASAGNPAPVANPDTVNLLVDQEIDIDVLANDTDASGIDTIQLVEITVPPVHGTAMVLNKKIRYTPNPGYAGPDSLSYRIRDNALQYSNVAIVTITVTDSRPVANPDVFTVRRNSPTVIPSLGVLANDTPGAGNAIQVVAGVVVSALGRSVTINADGSFVYPAPDLVGTDTFSYTIVNNLGQSRTGQVTINIINVPASFSYILAGPSSSSGEACVQFGDEPSRSTYYSNATNLLPGAMLYQDDLFLEKADAGWYADGFNSFEVDSSGEVIDIDIC